MSYGQKGWQVAAPAAAQPRIGSGAAEDAKAPPPHEEAEPWPADEADPDRLLFPETYEAVRAVRARAEPSCIFVPREGEPFTREYGWKSGQNPLPGEEGFELAYAGHSVVVRGERLRPVFLALAGHRAHILRAWRGKWDDRPKGVPVIRSITIRLDDAPTEDGEG